MDKPTRASRSSARFFGAALQGKVVVAVGREAPAEQHVADHGQPGKKAVVLEHHGALDAGALDLLAGDRQRAAIGRLEPGDDA